MRYLVHKRDRGICALCGLDTDALYMEFKKIAHEKSEQIRTVNDARSRFLKQHGIPWSRSTGDWWDADHITPVIEGGGECGLANFRTLCIPCHRKETKRLHERLSKVRKIERADKKDKGRPLFANLKEENDV